MANLAAMPIASIQQTMPYCCASGIPALISKVSHVQGNKTIRLIGAFKLIKGLLLTSLAAGGFRFLNSDLEHALTLLSRHLRVDPGNKYFHWLMTHVVGLSPRLPLILIGSLFYGALFCTEGVGLLMQKRWAEYLAVIATGSFLPMEIYEIVKHASILKIILTTLNLAVVIYLIIRLKTEKQRVGN